MASNRTTAHSKRPSKIEAARSAAEDLIDAGSEYSFPASDPPSYMGGSAIAGPPPRDKWPREVIIRVPTDPAAVKPESPLTRRPHRLLSGRPFSPKCR